MMPPCRQSTKYREDSDILSGVTGPNLEGADLVSQSLHTDPHLSICWGGCLATSLKRKNKSFFILMNTIYMFSFVACALGVIPKKPVPTSRSRTFTPRFSFKSFVISTLTSSSSLIHFELVFNMV